MRCISPELLYWVISNDEGAKITVGFTGVKVKSLDKSTQLMMALQSPLMHSGIELGLLRKRPLVTSVLTRKSKSHQPFSYLIVIDFESTCWKDGKFPTNEIIEFPAVLLNTSNGQIENEFHFYCQPDEQPILSDFCKDLTGITQEQVDNGIPLRLCLKKFSHWLDKLQGEKGIMFTSVSDSTSANCTFVTWSDWDLGVCLLNECRRKQLLKPQQLNSWIDLRATYRKFYDRRPNGLNGALQDLGIEFEGREHSGLHDSRNTACLAYRMMCDGCILTVTKTLKGKTEIMAKSVTMPAMNTHISPTKSPLQKRWKGNSNGRQEVTSPNSKLKETSAASSETPERKRKKRIPVLGSQIAEIHQNFSYNSRSPRRLKCDTPDRKQKSRIPVSTRNSPNKKINVTENFTTGQIYADPQITNDLSNKSFPSKPGLTVKDSNVETAGKTLRKTGCEIKYESISNSPKKNVTKLSHNKVSDCIKTPSCNHSNQVTGSDSRVQTFKTPSSHSSSVMIGRGLNNINNSVSSFYSMSTRASAGKSSSTSVSSHSFRTPDTSSSFVSSTMKSTPPLCKCGRRAKRKMAQTPGPNCGRFFFSCGAGYQQNKGTGKNGCGYFQWENSTNMNKSSSNSSCNNSTICKPFTPVFGNSFTYGVSSNQRRNLGVRSSCQRPGIR